MAAAKRLRIEYIDPRENIEVVLSPRAQVNTEQHFGKPLTALDGVGPSYYIAWEAAKCAGKETRTFDEFLDAIVDVEMVDEPAGANPTVEAQQQGTSLS
ncbi:MAG: hypothetical protein ACRDTT_22980 [Pseudonocardiaceae bacterium]